MGDATVQAQQVRSRAYLVVWVVLLALTAATVAVSRLELLHIAAVISIGLATAKSALVLVYFMHLKQEPLILKVMLVIALLALGLIILLTFTDVSYRWGGHAHP